MDNAKFSELIKDRTKQFAIRVIKLFQRLSKSAESQIIGKQLLRSATSAAANYRAACRSRSDKEFYAKASIVVEELDESIFWLELLADCGIIKKSLLEDLLNEAIELVKILAKARKTTGIKLKK